MTGSAPAQSGRWPAERPRELATTLGIRFRMDDHAVQLALALAESRGIPVL
jgi:hypothetical protein